jgi:hypothetical protein
MIVWNKVRKVASHVIGLLEAEKVRLLAFTLCKHADVTELQVMAGKFGLTTQSRVNPSTP